MTPGEVSALVREEALGLGFHRVGIAPVMGWARHAHYQQWLAAGYAGEMDYLLASSEDRRDPRALQGDVRSIVCVALSYAHPEPLVPADALVRGRVARYARGTDYHHVLKARLYRLARTLSARFGRPLLYRACVDTAPLLEHEAAAAAGLGFIAKNTLLIAPGLGSQVLLGELLLDVAAEPGEVEVPRCGQCRACLEACPTGAFVDAYVLDARRCISYLTIELRGAIPRALRPLIGDHVLGCDICQDVCPFNAAAGAKSGGDPALAPPELVRARPPLLMLLGLGAAQYRRWVKRTAWRRISRAQLLRNTAVALGNVGGPTELEALGRAYARETEFALVRGHVAWAVGRIGERHRLTAPAAWEMARSMLGSWREQDPDETVREEVEHAWLQLENRPAGA